jgi:hypothetical protein
MEEIKIAEKDIEVWMLIKRESDGEAEKYWSLPTEIDVYYTDVARCIIPKGSTYRYEIKNKHNPEFSTLISSHLKIIEIGGWITKNGYKSFDPYPGEILTKIKYKSTSELLKYEIGNIFISETGFLSYKKPWRSLWYFLKLFPEYEDNNDFIPKEVLIDDLLRYYETPENKNENELLKLLDTLS